MSNQHLSINQSVINHIKNDKSNNVWTPSDFLNIGARDAIDKILQRLVASQKLRRISRGLYDKPRLNKLTGQLSTPNYKSVINAIIRRDQIRVLIDGMTCANDLGLTNAVPATVVIHTDARLRPIRIGNLIIQFRLSAPSKLYWAGRPAMHVIQALHWLHDSIKTGDNSEQDSIKPKLIRLLKKPKTGKKIIEDIHAGMHTLPAWMQQWLHKLLNQIGAWGVMERLTDLRIIRIS